MSEPEYLTSRSQELARYLAGCTSSTEDRDRIARTGEIFPPTSLRFKELRRKLKWVLELNSDRYFTLKRVKQAVQILLQEKHFSLPVQVPGFNEGELVETKAKDSPNFSNVLEKASVLEPWTLTTLRRRSGKRTVQLGCLFCSIFVI